MVLISHHNELPAYVDLDDGVYIQCGYLCGKDGKKLDGDNISYATQATEDINSMVISIMGCKIVAGILSTRYFDSGYLWIGLDKTNSEKLLSLQSAGKANGSIDNCDVSFLLKHSYFNRMHQALDALNPGVIDSLCPKSKTFTAIKKRRQNLSRCDLMDIQLDSYGQRQALDLILNSSAKAILIVTGPFGTGKTLLLAHAVYDVIENDGNARILVCAHHHKSADAFIEKYFGPMKEKGWNAHLVRLSNRSPHKSKFQRYYMQTFRIRGQEHQLQVVVSTFGYSISLLKILKPGFFTHIFLDEAAQTREPETIIPLCLASRDTKIVIAGDHFQVVLLLLFRFEANFCIFLGGASSACSRV